MSKKNQSFWIFYYLFYFYFNYVILYLLYTQPYFCDMPFRNIKHNNGRMQIPNLKNQRKLMSLCLNSKPRRPKRQLSSTMAKYQRKCIQPL